MSKNDNEEEDNNAQDAQEWLFSKEKKYQLGSIVLDGMIAHFLMVTITQPWNCVEILTIAYYHEMSCM